jgi:sporulation protein YlmC with PRC-barrel domain
MKKQLGLELGVQCLDGRGGKISKVVIDPDSHQPTHLVVKRGRLHVREILVPVSLVAEVTEETVFLNVTRETLVGLSDYEFTVRKGEFQKPLMVGYPRPHYMGFPASNKSFMVLKQRNVPERSVAVEKSMAILDIEGHKVGKVEGIIVDSRKRQGRYLLFQRMHGTVPQLIPSDLIDDVSEGNVRLRIDRDYMERLPVYTRRTARRWARA